MRHYRHQGHRTHEHQALLVSLLPLGEGKTVVLQGTGSYQNVGQMFHGIHLQVLPHGQNQCPEGGNFKFLVDFNGSHPRGVGEVAGLHLGMPTPWDGKLARALEILRGAYAHVKWARRYRCWRSISLPYYR